MLSFLLNLLGALLVLALLLAGLAWTTWELASWAAEFVSGIA